MIVGPQCLKTCCADWMKQCLSYARCLNGANGRSGCMSGGVQWCACCSAFTMNKTAGSSYVQHGARREKSGRGCSEEAAAERSRAKGSREPGKRGRPPPSRTACRAAAPARSSRKRYCQPGAGSSPRANCRGTGCCPGNFGRCANQYASSRPRPSLLPR